MATPPSASREYRGSSAAPTLQGEAFQFGDNFINDRITDCGSSRRQTASRSCGLLDQGGRLSSVAATFRRWRQNATELERMAEDGRGNGAGAQGLWTRRATCLHRPRHIPRLVQHQWHKPGQRRTQKVRRGGGDREIWPTGLTSTRLGRTPAHRQPSLELHVRPGQPWGLRSFGLSSGFNNCSLNCARSPGENLTTTATLDPSPRR